MITPGVVFDAQGEARRLLDEARRDADALREAARREGFAAGRQEALARITEDAVRLGVDRARSAAAAEGELRRLAVRIAEKILARQLTLTPEAVTDVVRQALGAVRARRVTVRVHPDDLPLTQEITGAAFVADPLIERGGCIVDTGHGTVDARLATQLAAIERALED